MYVLAYVGKKVWLKMNSAVTGIMVTLSSDEILLRLCLNSGL